MGLYGDLYSSEEKIAVLIRRNRELEGRVRKLEDILGGNVPTYKLEDAREVRRESQQHYFGIDND